MVVETDGSANNDSDSSSETEVGCDLDSDYDSEGKKHRIVSFLFTRGKY